MRRLAALWHGSRRTRANGRFRWTPVRLLLLTGCRKNEVLTLRWSDYRERRLFLRDGKTGPRTVWLSGVARNVLDRIDRTSAWVFPARRTSGPAGPMYLRYFW